MQLMLPPKEYQSPLPSTPPSSVSQVTATSVIKQAGGISQGAFGSRIKFDTGVQFTITDPAATATVSGGASLGPLSVLKSPCAASPACAH